MLAAWQLPVPSSFPTPKNQSTAIMNFSILYGISIHLYRFNFDSEPLSMTFP